MVISLGVIPIDDYIFANKAAQNRKILLRITVGFSFKKITFSRCPPFLDKTHLEEEGGLGEK